MKRSYQSFFLVTLTLLMFLTGIPFNSSYFTAPVADIPDHDLIIMPLERAHRVRPNEPTIINVTVMNCVLNNETNVKLLLWIDGTLTANQTYSSLLIGASETLSYQWTPLKVGTYNITAYTPPVSGEKYTQNNCVAEMVIVSDLPPPTITSNALEKSNS